MALHLLLTPAQFLARATELAITASDKSALTVDGTRVKIEEKLLEVAHAQAGDPADYPAESLGRYLVVDFGARVSYDDLAAFAQQSDWETAAELRYTISVSAMALPVAYLRATAPYEGDPFQD